VLIHGIGSRWQIWAPVLDRLAAERDVVAVDLPGFAGSPASPSARDVPGLVDAVEAFLAELGLDRPHVAGNSLGGGIALELARRGAVASATAISPIGFWTERELRWCQASLTRSRKLGRLADPVLPTLLASTLGRDLTFWQVLARPSRMSPEEGIASVRALIAAPAFDEVLASFTAYRFRDPEQLRGTRVTVAWGDRDFLLLHRQARRAQRLLPGGEHVTLPRCGHAPFTDDPELVARVLLAGSAEEPTGRAYAENSA